MADNRQHQRSNSNSRFAKTVNSKLKRKLKAQRQHMPGTWFGLGMMGLIGWSVAVPTLLGAALGLWLDQHYSDEHSWTLALLVAGLMIGCWNAWHWIAKEEEQMQEDEQDDE